MKITGLAEATKNKRKIVRFAGITKLGRRPAGWSPRLEALYGVLMTVTAPQLLSELLAHPDLGQWYLGKYRRDNLRRELCWLVEWNMASWELADGSTPPSGLVWIREPTRNERSYGHQLNETDWLVDGVVMETPATTWTPTTPSGILVRRLDHRPHGKSRSLRLWECIPEVHSRFDELHLTPEAAVTYRTPRDQFQGLIELVKAGSIEMLPLGL